MCKDGLRIRSVGGGPGTGPPMTSIKGVGSHKKQLGARAGKNRKTARILVLQKPREGNTS